MNRQLRSIALVLALAALPAQAATELKLWFRGTGDSEITYKEIFKAFEAKTGVKIQYFNTLSDFEQRLARAAAGGDLPDVIIDDAAYLGQFRNMGIIAPIDRASVKGGQDVHETAWESAQAADGKYYAVPTSAQSFTLFVRKDWREKLNMPVPKTWDDIEKLATAFVEKDPDGNGKKDTYGFVFPGSTSRGYTSWFVSSYLYQAGGDFVRQTPDGKYKGAMEEPAAATAVKFVRGLICKGLTQPGAINHTTADAIPFFRSGQTGLFHSGPYHIALFSKEPGADKFEVVTAPAGPKGTTVLAEGTSGYIANASQSKKEAQMFLEFLISKEGQELGMTGMPVVRLPVNKNVNTGAMYKDPRWDVFQTLYAKSSRYVPRLPNWPAVRQLTADGLNRALARCDSNVEEELKKLNADLNAELAKQGVLGK